MKRSRLLAGAALALILALSGCGLKKSTQAAEAEVDRFHKHWNADEFQEIYDEAHTNFRNSQTVDETSGTLKRVKANYGEFKNANKRSWGFNSDNGVTEIKVKYDSVYARGSAVEAFVYRMAGNKPLLLSYDIMSPETAKKREAEEKNDREAKRKSEEEKRKADQDARKSPNG